MKAENQRSAAMAAKTPINAEIVVTSATVSFYPTSSEAYRSAHQK
jgi:hypothetical protein